MDREDRGRFSLNHPPVLPGRRVHISHHQKSWTYNYADRPLTETITGGPLAGWSVVNVHNQYLKRTVPSQVDTVRIPVCRTGPPMNNPG
jgi:hypothetical protein